MRQAQRSTGQTERASKGERGWALLGLILAMAVMGIWLAAMAPNVRFQVRRDKEAEMLYRGEQMARAIARYYNNARLGPINIIPCPQPRGCLVELDKLKEPYIVGVNEHKLVRLSATIDPMTSDDWEPVRLRDPRLMAVLQAYAADTGLQIPVIYELMAAPPAPILDAPLGGSSSQPGSGSNPDGSGNPQGGQGGLNPPVNQRDPLAHFFDSSGSGLSNVPIIGVAPKIKGKAVRTLYGLQNYEEWVFIFIPAQNIPTGPSIPINPTNPTNPTNPNNPNPGGGAGASSNPP